jgi:RNA polymerase sigma-70 factor (ECF subfamily)
MMHPPRSETPTVPAYAPSPALFPGGTGSPASSADGSTIPLDCGEAGNAAGPGQDSETGEEFARLIIDRYGRDLDNRARRLCGGDPERARDLVQETVLRAWRKRKSAQGKTKAEIRSWVMTIAKNAAIDVARARWSRPAETGPAVLDRIAAAGAEDRIVESHLVRQALAGLSEDHRAVIVLMFYRQASVAEAAALLGIPPGTVKSRTYYAVRNLRLILQEQGVTGL